MNLTDIFNQAPFSVVSLTESMEHLPFKPSRVTELGLFESVGINTTVAVVEEHRGQLSLLANKQRGGEPNTRAKQNRVARSIPTAHYPFLESIQADDLIGKRKFGSENELESVTSRVNDTLEEMRQSHEVTEEWMKIGALKGTVTDGEGSTLLDLYTTFNITAPTAVDFALATDTTQVGSLAAGVIRTIENALGAQRFDKVHALCGNDFWDAFIEHPEVKYAFQYYQESRLLREDLRYTGFEYKGVVWENYRGSINGTPFIPVKDCRFFPTGGKGLFKIAYAPANFVEAVGTQGQPFYAKQRVQDFDMGIDILTQSNPMAFCTKPGALVRGYIA